MQGCRTGPAEPPVVAEAARNSQTLANDVSEDARAPTAGFSSTRRLRSRAEGLATPIVGVDPYATIEAEIQQVS